MQAQVDEGTSSRYSQAHQQFSQEKDRSTMETSISYVSLQPYEMGGGRVVGTAFAL
jgi:hypothetical protein